MLNKTEDAVENGFVLLQTKTKHTLVFDLEGLAKIIQSMQCVAMKSDTHSLRLLENHARILHDRVRFITNHVSTLTAFHGLQSQNPEKC